MPKAKDEIRALGETLNEMLDRINESLIAQKRFIADASHEIRTPITIMQTELELALKSNDPVMIRESIDITLSEIERLNKLTSSLIALAKLENHVNDVSTEQFELNEMFIDTIKLLSSKISEKNIIITEDISEQIFMVGAKKNIRSIMINLLDNAVKYSNNENFSNRRIRNRTYGGVRGRRGTPPPTRL